MATVAAINSLGGFEYNPRGNIWLNDDSNLGHKLLMKMGWSKGKGLGKNENGIKENIKVKVKSTGSGVGFKDDSFFKIQSTEYDLLLKSISENCSPKDRVLESGGKTNKQKNGGLEQRSQEFRNRLHYRKFIRGKDLSKYSEKDMKSIFILNKTSENEKVPSVPEDSSVSLQKDSDPQEGQCTNVMDTYNSSLSISEYFDLKMKAKKNIIPEAWGVNSDAQPIYPDSEKLENESLISAETSSSKLKVRTGDTGDVNSIAVNKELLLSALTVRKEKRKRLKEEKCYRNIADTDEANEIREIKKEDSSKSSKKRKVSVTDSVIVDKEDKPISLTDSNVHLSQSDPVESTGSTLPDSEKDSVKKQKKTKKQKGKHLKMLKSCLKRNFGEYNVKNVSFSESVSYKVIDSETECKIPCIAHEPESGTVPIQMDTQTANNTACLEAEKCETRVNIEESAALLYSPCSKSSQSYNPWIESQKQARKMKLYKNMLKNIKKHDILKSTNLLFIRGYGNWGY